MAFEISLAASGPLGFIVGSCSVDAPVFVSFASAAESLSGLYPSFPNRLIKPSLICFCCSLRSFSFSAFNRSFSAFSLALCSASSLARRSFSNLSFSFCSSFSLAARSF